VQECTRGLRQWKYIWKPEA